MEELEKSLGELFVKAPALPVAWKEFMVKAAPYLAIIGVVISLPVVFAVIGLSAFVAPLAAMGGAVPAIGQMWLGVAFAVASIILNGLAIPGLFARSMAGWRFSFYSVLVGAVQSIVSMNIIGLIIGTGLGLYILFQLRSYYGKGTIPAAPAAK